MKLKNIDWKSLITNALFALYLVVTGAVLGLGLSDRLAEKRLDDLATNQQTMTQFLVQNHNRLNKRVDILEQRQDGMLPLPTKEEK